MKTTNIFRSGTSGLGRGIYRYSPDGTYHSFKPTGRFDGFEILTDEDLRELAWALGDSRYVQSRWTSARNPKLVARIERAVIRELGDRAMKRGCDE
jgi:hypothetical protein